MPEILTTTEDAVLTITLNRPEKRNALNDGLIGELKVALEKVHGDDSLCAAVIRGAGTDFCSGADLSALQKISESSAVENREDARSLMELLALIRNVRIPVIAAVHGRALAGGCGLATACDIVLAAESAVFGYPEVKIGFVPAMVMAILRRNISEKRAFELITRGFQFNAKTAHEWGLVNQVIPDDSFDVEVKKFAAAYNGISRSAVMLSKNLFYEMDGMNFRASLEAGVDINTLARMTEDCQKGIAKFLEKK